MSKAEKQTKDRAPHESDEIVALKKMTRVLELLLKLQVQSVKGSKSQNEIIVMLDGLGCRQSEISEILGATPNTVSASLHKAKIKAKKK